MNLNLPNRQCVQSLHEEFTWISWAQCWLDDWTSGCFMPWSWFAEVLLQTKFEDKLWRLALLSFPDRTGRKAKPAVSHKATLWGRIYPEIGGVGLKGGLVTAWCWINPGEVLGASATKSPCSLDCSVCDKEGDCAYAGGGDIRSWGDGPMEDKTQWDGGACGCDDGCWSWVSCMTSRIRLIQWRFYWGCNDLT